MVWWQLCSADIDAEEEAVLIFEHIIYLKPEYLLTEHMGEDLNATTVSVVSTCM